MKKPQILENEVRGHINFGDVNFQAKNIRNAETYALAYYMLRMQQ